MTLPTANSTLPKVPLWLYRLRSGSHWRTICFVEHKGQHIGGQIGARADVGHDQLADAGCTGEEEVPMFGIGKGDGEVGAQGVRIDGAGVAVETAGRVDGNDDRPIVIVQSSRHLLQ